MWFFLLIFIQGIICIHSANLVGKTSYFNNDLTPETDRAQVFYGRLNDIYSDEGEVVEVKFLTKIRSRRDVSSKDFHIIQLKVPSQDTHISIHLHKNQNLIVSSELTVNENSKESEVNDLADCFYTGKVSEEPEGRAALSSCDDDGGFTGHILVGDDHFVIEPLEDSNSNEIRKPAIEGKPTVLHKLFKAGNILKQENSTHSDVLHVPKDELEKAVAEMANSTKAQEDEDEDKADAKDEKEEVTQTLISSTLESDENEEDIFITNSFASKSKNKKKKAKPKGKMSVAGAKIVEIAVFSDARLLKVWQKRYPKTSKTKLRAFILNLINNMNLLYQQQSLGVEVTFRLVYLEMMTANPKGLENNDGEATKYLKSFCKYAGDLNTNGNKWDHALLLTGFDIKDGRDKLVAGMAWLGTMCLKYWSCSISEGTSFSSVFILTHEIGHSLGMDHDGLGPSIACNSEKYLMSPTTGPGKVTWSSCSSQNMKDFITKGTPELKKSDLSSVPHCLTRASPLKDKRIKFSGKLPGEVFGTKVQCQYECGSTCTAPAILFETICSMLTCEKQEAGKVFKVNIDAHPALEGTTCGIGKARALTLLLSAFFILKK